MRKAPGFLLVQLLSLIALSLESNDVWNTIDQLSYTLMREKNFETHNTELFRRRPDLHVRRGLDLTLALQFPQCDNSDKAYKFELVENDKTVFTWIEKPEVQDSIFNFHLFVNRSIPVGQYKLDTIDPCSENEFKPVRLGDVNVMFNPWVAQRKGVKKRVRKQTPILMDEYLNNDFGYIWTGTVGLPWDYAIRSGVVMDALDVLREQMSPEVRSNKVLYSRSLTELIGSSVLYGRWDGRYSDGVEPTAWVGSKDILKRWLRTRQPVRYGQCWVFAGILTSLLRASGIPARTVTNYRSHHDRGLTDNGRAVLRPYDNIVQTDESTWNFHVWSEAWLERPDLGQPAGWNAVDATPQEPSPLAPNQPYRAGPAYVPYIRSNMRNSNYDTYFILAEVNAVQICPLTGRTLPSAVGTAVVTKKPGTQPDIYSYTNAEFITTNYKIGSSSKKSARASDSTNPVLPPPYTGCERDGGMRLTSTPLRPRVGEDFVLTVSEGNVSAQDTVIRMELRNYMGESLGFIQNFTGKKELNVTESIYLPYLRNSSIFRFSVGTYNGLGGFIFHDALLIRLNYDQLQVQAVKDPNSPTITLTLTYSNPLSIPMTRVLLSVSEPNDTYITLVQPDIPAATRFTSTVEV